MIIGMLGKVGSSKTLLMTAFNILFYEKGFSLYSNYDLLNIDFKKIDNTNFDKLIDKTIVNNIVSIDELVPNTKIRNINTIDLEMVISQIRKYIKENSHLLYTVQFEHQIPPDFLMHTDIIIKCYTVRRAGKYFRTVANIFISKEINPFNERLGNDVKFDFLNRSSFDLSPFFKYYGTYQIMKQISKDYSSIIEKYTMIPIYTKNKLKAKIIENKDATSFKEADMIADMIQNRREEIKTKSLINSIVNKESIASYIPLK